MMKKLEKKSFTRLTLFYLQILFFLQDDQSFLILSFDIQWDEIEIPVFNYFKLLQATHLRCWILKAKEGKARREALWWQIDPFLN